MVTKVVWEEVACSTYHLEASPVSMRWNNLRQIDSSVMELEEHHIWKDQIWLEGSSLARPSNLGMSEGSLVGIAGQLRSWRIGSLIS